MMIDVTDLLSDPDFCSNFEIERTLGEWKKGRFLPDKKIRIKKIHPVQPAKADELDQIPEGDRKQGMMKFFCVKPEEFYLTSESSKGDGGKGNVSDVIIFNGYRYKVVHVMPWNMNGWQRAFAYPTGKDGEDG